MLRGATFASRASDSSASEPLADEIELVERTVPDRDRSGARVAIGLYSNLQPEEVLKVLLHRSNVGVLR